MRKRMSALHDARRVSEDARLNPCGRMAHRSLGGRPSPRCHRDAVVSVLVWSMVGIALWHFTVFLPDHFWSGIVGAFLGAVIGAFVFGFLVNGFHVPGQDDTDLLSAIEAIPGALIGMGLVYLEGMRRGVEPEPTH